MSRVHPARAALERVYRAGLAAVDPQAAVRRHVERDGDEIRVLGRALAPGQQIVVIAAGKAAAPMAAAVEKLAADRIREGLVVTRDGHARGYAFEKLALREAAHPIPDGRSEAAAHEVRRLAAGSRSQDLLLVLLSGGATALLAAPVADLGLDELAETNRLLLESGADIAEMNTVRKHLSLLSGGRLAAAASCARIDVLAISDVPGDREDVIASGPCSPDPTRHVDALEVLRDHQLLERVPVRVRRALEAGARGELPETLCPGDAAFSGVRYRVIASNRDAVEAAALAARTVPMQTLLVEETLEGEAREVARECVARARRVDGAMPVCIIAGGETSVRVRGDGLGGRSQELALAAAIELDTEVAPGEPDIVLLAAGTDGSDGPTTAAGAWADRETCARARALGLDPQAALAANDSHHFFAAEGGLFVTGPTGTNVMDLVIVWVGELQRPSRHPGERS